MYRWGQKKLFQEAGRVEKTWTELAQTFSNTNLQIFCQKLWNWKKVFLIQNHNFGLKYCYFFPAVKLTQPPESPYTRRNKMIFWGARTQACADFGAIGAIAQKIYLRKSDACVDVCGGFKQKKEIRESFLKKSDVLYVNACGGFPKKIYKCFLRKFAHATRLQKKFASVLRNLAHATSRFCLYNPFSSLVARAGRVAEWAERRLRKQKTRVRIRLESFCFFYFGACANFFARFLLRKFNACVDACVKFTQICKTL